jgi:hypothetical protein
VKWWSAILLIPLLFTVACARDEKSKDQPAAKPADRPPAATEQPRDRDAGEVMSKREITLTQTAAQEQPQLPETQQTERQRLLALESVQVLPEDFAIGPLADLIGIDRSTLEIVSVSTRFLDSLQEGSVEGETLHAEVREELSTSIRYYLERDLIPLTYRIGAITTESYAEGEENQSVLDRRTAWMNLRLFGDPGVCEGELYLERSAGRWYVSDLQIDFQRMGREYVRDEETYYPTSYGWGIQ